MSLSPQFSNHLKQFSSGMTRSLMSCSAERTHHLFLICNRYSVASITELNATYNAQTSLSPGWLKKFPKPKRYLKQDLH